MPTIAHISKKLGFTTTSQEYFAEHYTRMLSRAGMADIEMWSGAVNRQPSYRSRELVEQKRFIIF